VWINAGMGGFHKSVDTGGRGDPALTRDRMHRLALDANNDGFVDLFVSNGGNQANELWINTATAASERARGREGRPTRR
jgi:hypothetical protein